MSITVTTPLLFQGMSAHDDIPDAQVAWCLENGRTAGLLILALLMCGVVVLLAMMR